MPSTASPSPAPGAADSASRASLLLLGALGVVYGDIGTSPLYAIKETFAGPHPLPIDRFHILGVLSLMFWTITILVSIKYVAIMLRADNRGEGGVLVLLGLVQRAVAQRPSLATLVVVLGIFAGALFYGDCMLTPAISVLSAVEGLKIAAPPLEHAVIPITIAIVVMLFLIQRRGTGAVGNLFGPMMIVWFGTLAILGIRAIAHKPEVLLALSPHYAVGFLLHDGWVAFLSLGSVFLAVTGAEALFADLGHFGRSAIRRAWYGLVLPALVLNYFGQGALLLRDPATIANPFILLAPEWGRMALVVLAAIATVIASQATISGAFSVTQQAIHLGYLPRIRIVHTSASERGQIYVPFINWTLFIAVVALVLGFRTSSDLAAAYGIAVSGTMVLSSVLLAMVATFIWQWQPRWIWVVFGGFLFVDTLFLLANATKIPHGGWFPLVVGAATFVLLTTWKQGRAALAQRLQRDTLSIEEFIASLSDKCARVSGTAVFLTGSTDGVPTALLHNLKHNKVVHERNILMTVIVDDVPKVDPSARIEARDLGDGFRRINLRYGFLDTIDVPKALAHAKHAELGFQYDPMTISYFLSRETLVGTIDSPLPFWRRWLFFWMSRNAAGTMEFLQLPTNRVVELGSQIQV